MTVIGGNGLERSTKQGCQGKLAHLGQSVPRRHVQSGAGHHRDAATTDQAQATCQHLIELEGRQFLTAQDRAQGVNEDARAFQRQRGVGKDIRMTDDAIAQMQIDQHEWRGGYRTDTGLDRIFERHHHRTGNDALDDAAGCFFLVHGVIP